jgi:hypothetical protein
VGSLNTRAALHLDELLADVESYVAAANAAAHQAEVLNRDYDQFMRRHTDAVPEGR